MPKDVSGEIVPVIGGRILINWWLDLAAPQRPIVAQRTPAGPKAGPGMGKKGGGDDESAGLIEQVCTGQPCDWPLLDRVTCRFVFPTPQCLGQADGRKASESAHLKSLNWNPLLQWPCSPDGSKTPPCSTWVPRHFTPVWAVSHIAGFVSIPTAVLQLSQHSNRAMSSCSFAEIRSATQLNLLSAGEWSWKNVWAERAALEISALPI